MVAKKMWIQKGKYKPVVGKVNRWVTTSETKFHSIILKEIVVPPRFETDLASVPKSMQKWFPKDNPQYAHACIVHDWLCKKKNPANYPQADFVFWEALRASEVVWWKRFCMVSFVIWWHFVGGLLERGKYRK